MAEVKFYLEKRRDKATGKTIETNVPIFLFYSFNGMRLQYYTGYRIDKCNWDGTKVKRNVENAAEINKALRSLTTKVEEIHSRADALGERLTPEYFRDHLSGKKKDAKNGHLIWEYYQEYLDGLKINVTKKTIEASTITRDRFLEFSKATRTTITFDRVNPDFWEVFKNWCFTDRKYFNNYTGLLIKKFIAFMNWAVKKKYTTNIEFRDVEPLKEETEIIYLEYSELHHFLNFRFDNIQHQYIRDLYCLGCFTGMRKVDLIKLLPENIQTDKIVFRIAKVKDPNIVPLNKYSRLLLEKNRGIDPVTCMPKIKDFDKTLKDAMQKAELTRPVQIVHYRGADAFYSTKPLWDVASFHTSKKTFITSFIEGGGQLTTVKAITGNKSDYVMKRYYKIADTFKTSEMHRIYGK